MVVFEGCKFPPVSKRVQRAHLLGSVVNGEEELPRDVVWLVRDETGE